MLGFNSRKASQPQGIPTKYAGRNFVSVWRNPSGEYYTYSNDNVDSYIAGEESHRASGSIHVVGFVFVNGEFVSRVEDFVSNTNSSHRPLFPGAVGLEEVIGVD